MPFLGGFNVTSVEWIDSQSILVRFTSTYTRETYQLYAGRTLIGATVDPDARSIVGRLSPSHYPQVLRLVAVADTEAGQEWGATFPPRPYNRARFVVDTSSFPADADVVELAVSGGETYRQPHGGEAAQTLITEPLGPTGTFTFNVRSYDDKPSGGNTGTQLQTTQDILTHPPDVTQDSSGNRFIKSLASGTLTVNCTLPPDQAA